MAWSSNDEYKVIVDKMVSSDQNVVVSIDGAMYKDEIAEARRYANISDIANEGAVSTDIAFTVAGGALGTQPTFNGAPLFVGSYVITGPQVHFHINVEFDNITNFGTGQYYLDLPFPAKYAYELTAGCLHDVSTSTDYPITGHVYAGESRMLLKSIDAQGNTSFAVPFTHTTPVTLTTADSFHISGNYIADFS